jgi:hypothetical protein
MVPDEKVLELLTIWALKPASDVIAVVDRATTASDAVARAPKRADAVLNLNINYPLGSEPAGSCSVGHFVLR